MHRTRGKGTGFLCLLRAGHPSESRPPRSSPGQSFGFFLHPHYIGMTDEVIGDWTQSLAPFPFSTVRERKWWPCNHVVGSISNRPPPLGDLGALQKPSHWHNERHLFGFHHLSNSQGFSGSVSQRNCEQRPNMYLLIYITVSHNIAGRVTMELV